MTRAELFAEFPMVRDFPVGRAHITDFPLRADGGFVYVISVVKDGEELPLYIGETGRLNERIADYCSKQFAAATDFRVGEAIGYLRDNVGLAIRVRYKLSTDRQREEYRLVRDCQTSGIRLLNDLVGYDYQRADKEDERTAIRNFCSVLLRAAACRCP